MAYRRLRPSKNEKPERNKTLYDLHVAHPEMTLNDLGIEIKWNDPRVGISISATRVLYLLRRYEIDHGIVPGSPESTVSAYKPRGKKAL